MAGKIYVDKARQLCPYCYREFTPHAKVGDRQISCGSEVCKRQHKKEINKKWRRLNPDYSKDHYTTYLKPWLETHPGYLKEYRRKKKQSVRTRLSLFGRHSRTGIGPGSDIKEQLSSVGTMPNRQILSDIKDELSYVNSTSCLVFCHLHDIKDQLNALSALSGRLSP